MYGVKFSLQIVSGGTVSWADEEFLAIDLGDTRRNERAKR
ncbi:transposase DNA-binding-containing protein, partial [uncultured Thiodictyon sp.]